MLISNPVPHDFPLKMRPPLVRWVTPGWLGGTGQGYAMVAGRIYYIPIFVSEETLYDRIGFNVTVAPAGDANVAIYEWNEGIPRNQLFISGGITHAFVGAQEEVIAETLPRGYFFLAIRCNGAPTLTGFAETSAITSPVQGTRLLNDAAAIDRCILYDDAAWTDPAGVVDGYEVNRVCVRLREA